MWPQSVVQRDHRSLVGGHVQQVRQRFRQVVRMDRATGHAHDRDARLGLPVPSEIVGHPHGARRVARHRVDAAVSGARPHRHHRGRLGGEAIQPFAGGHWLAGCRIVTEPAPVSLVLDLLVRDGPLDDQHERFQFASVRFEEPFEEVVGAPVRSALEVDQWPVDGDPGQAGERAESDLLDAGLSGGSQRH